MLKIEKLTKYYKKVVGIKDLTLTINKGEIFGFIGPNGSGKSTTIRCIMNFIRKNSGRIYIDEKQINYGDFLYKSDIGYLPGEVFLYDDYKVIDMLNYASSLYKKDCSKKIKELVKLFKVDVNKKISELSLGNKKKVGIIIALMHDPKLLILDEPTSGLDPIMQNIFFDYLKKEKENGKTIFFSTHNLMEVKKVCDYVGIVKDSKLIKIVSIDNIHKNTSYDITIISDEIKNIKLSGSMIIRTISDNKINFMYKGDINNLIKQISSIKISSILIEEPSLEETFINYYK